MANQVQTRVLREGPRNVVVKVAGVLATSDTFRTAFVNLANLNANGGMPQASLVGLRLLEASWSVGTALSVILEWESADPEIIYAFSYGDDAELCDFGGLAPDRGISGYTGNLSFRTVGFTGPTAFSFVAEFAKIFKES